MKGSKTNTLLEEALRLVREDYRDPFPYADSRQLTVLDPERYENFITHLDLYFSEIAGYCSWGKGILKWPKQKVEEAEKKLSSSFFERYPGYQAIELLIDDTNTPTLCRKLRLYDRIRTTLLDLLSALRLEQL
ncbi:MAG TPA: YxiJ family protein [Pyrinomonadaceae bacterium]|nr:YxiJ family protein [Pyrinomonadaceae bacterium]